MSHARVRAPAPRSSRSSSHRGRRRAAAQKPAGGADRTGRLSLPSRSDGRTRSAQCLPTSSLPRARGRHRASIEEENARDARLLARDLRDTTAEATTLAELPDWEPAQDAKEEMTALIDMGTRAGAEYGTGSTEESARRSASAAHSARYGSGCPWCERSICRARGSGHHVRGCRCGSRSSDDANRPAFSGNAHVPVHRHRGVDPPGHGPRRPLSEPT